MKNIIRKISSKYFFYNVFLFYTLLKLIPIGFISKYTTYIVSAIGVFVFFTRILNYILYDKICLKNNIYRILSLIIFLLSCISFFYNCDFHVINDDIKVLLVIFINFLVLFVPYKNDDTDCDKYLFDFTKIIVIFSMVYAVLCILYVFIEKQDRLWGITDSVWSYCSYLLVALASSIYQALNSEGKYKKVCIFNSILHIFLIIITQQRSAYLGLLVATFFTFFIVLKKYKFIYIRITIKNFFIRYKVFVFIIAAITLFICFYINPSIIFKKIISMSTSGRIPIWVITIKALFDGGKLLLGVCGNSYNYFSNYIIKNIPNAIQNGKFDKLYYLIANSYFHNIYIGMLSYFGIATLITVFILLILIIKKMLNEKDLSLQIFYGFIILAPLFIGFFDDNMFVNISYLPNLMFFIVSSRLCEQN